MSYSSDTRGSASDDDAFYSPPDRGDRGDGARTVDEQNEDPHTTLIHKSICGGAHYKEGDEINLRVVKDYGDEYEVAHSEPEKEREPGAGDSQQPPIPSDDEMMGAGTQG